MDIIQLISKLAILLAIVIISGMIGERWQRHFLGSLIQGLLFGVGSMLAIFNPVIFEAGIQFDGRSVLLSLCGFFFGPWAALISTSIAILARYQVGGEGWIIGSLVATTSGLIGYLFNLRHRDREVECSNWELAFFSIIVHIVMVLLLLGLPLDPMFILSTLAPTIMLTFPLATFLGGRMMLDQQARTRYFEALANTQEQLRASLYSIGDGVITTDVKQRIMQMNPIAEKLTGWPESEARGKQLPTVFNIIGQDTGAQAESPATKALSTGEVVSRTEGIFLIAKDGTKCPIAESGAVIRNRAGIIIGVVLVFRDQTAEQEAKAQLEENEKRFRSVFNLQFQFMSILSPDGRILEINEYPLTVLGMGRQEVVGDYMWDSIWFRKLEGAKIEWLEMLAKAAQQQGPLVTDMDFMGPSGDMRRSILALTAVKNANGQVIYYIAQCNDVTEIREAELKLRNNQHLLENAQRIAKLGSWELNLKTKKLVWSDEVFNIFGAHRDQFDETFEGFYSFIHPEDRDKVLNEQGVGLSGDRPMDVEHRIVRPNGEIRYVHERAELVYNEQKVPVKLTGTVQDITEYMESQNQRQMLEQQLRQSQKMEAIGQLAGGIAHDFNNLMGVILGNTELALLKLEEDHSAREDLMEILDAGRRSAKFTGQLLGFARRQAIAPKVVDLNDCIDSTIAMLSRLIGENIELEWRPGPNLKQVKLDTSQVDQILTNLVVNARDAIDHIGKIIIETSHEQLDDSYAKTHMGFTPGEYIQLTVSDNGCGMSKATLERVFEPFFTTKSVGKGTGLGLATVYGIVKQNKGFINVYSEPGIGTTFRVYFPCAESEESADRESSQPASPDCGSEIVLLVEDEDSLLRLTKNMLEKLGYTVLAAGSPRDALNIIAGDPGQIDVLLTDVIMPGMSGKDLKAAVQKVRPEIKVVFMSGYTADVIANHGILEPGITFLHKPFTLHSLAKKVREALSC